MNIQYTILKLAILRNSKEFPHPKRIAKIINDAIT